MGNEKCPKIGVDPENPNRLQSLTSAPVVIMLERCDFLYLFTARERVSNHATPRRNLHRLHLDLVPVSSLHAEGPSARPQAALTDMEDFSQ